MKERLTTIAGLAMIVALLSGSFALANDGPSDGYTNDAVIVRAYYPNLDIGNRVLISFKPWIFETDYEEGYHLMKVTQREIDLLTDAGLQVVVADQQRLPMVQSIPNYPCYQTVEETFAFAEALVAAYPGLATWTDVGDSWEKSVGLGGCDMMVLRLTNSAIPGPKPKLFVTGAIHAREYATAPLLVRFAEYLTDNYGADADATWILDHHEVHLMLHANPDGRKQAEGGISWRKNANQNYCGPTSSNRGADLNRNFSYQWGCCGGSSDNPCSETYRGPSPASEPETQAIQDYLRAQFPDQRGPNLNGPALDDATGVYLDIHSYGELVLWPWGFTSSPAPNGTQLQTLGRKFAYWNNYVPQQAIGLYPTDGATDDFGYGDLGVASYSFELGTAFFQLCNHFENTIVPDNMPALIYAAKVVRTPYMTPAGPDAYDLSLSDDPVPVGTPVTLCSTINDTRYGSGAEPTQDIVAAEYYVDTPPWVSGSTAISMSASDGSFNSKTENVEAVIDTTGLSDGRHIIFVRGQDMDGNWGAFSAVFLNVTSGMPTPTPDTVVRIEPPQQTVQIGAGNFTADVAIANVVNLGSFEFVLAFSPNIVHVEGVVLDDFLASTGRSNSIVGPEINNEAGTVHFGAFSFGELPGPDGSSVLATVSFSPQASGESDLHLQDVQVTNTVTETIAVELQDGHVTVLGCIPGDMDCDCDVDVADIMMVANRWHTCCDDPDPDNNPDTPNYEARYDLNSDCDIDIVDIMLVAVHWGETCP